jgi:outer membrane immunogenic protein
MMLKESWIEEGAMRGIVLASAVFFGFGSVAVAADLPARMPVKAPVVAPVFSWTGCYAGGTLGWNRHNTWWRDIGGWQVTTGAEYILKDGGVIYGVDAGCNLQAGALVVGAEADLSYSNAHNEFLWGLSTQVDSKAKWIGTARLRAGLAFDRTMIFVTGGFAGSNSSTTWTDPSGIWIWDSKNYGTAFGGGIEHVLQDPRWAVRLEALWLKFKTYRADLGIASYPIDVRYRDLIVRVALNYRFQTGATIYP